MIYYIILVLAVVALASWVAKLYKDKKESDGEVALVKKERDEFASFGQGISQYQEKLQVQKQEYKNKILDLIKEVGKVGNKDIKNLLKVSEATATRYLDELEKEGKIKQTGKTGRSVFYE